MAGTPPPTESPKAPSSPLPPPRRRPKERKEPSNDDFDQLSMTAPEDQKGFSYLVKFPNDPLRAVCAHYNVKKAPTLAAGALPDTIEMEVISNGQMPTHALALSKHSEQESPSRPVIVPIDADIWRRRMTIPLPIVAPEATSPPAPQYDAARAYQVISLPVVQVLVPHPDNVPILLLFALALEPLPNMLAMCLLPGDVVGEFPHAKEMANVMARGYDVEDIIAYVHQNRRIWENALSLGVKDTSILDIVEKAWKVTNIAHQKFKRSLV